MSSDVPGILQLPLDAWEGVWDELRADGELPNAHQHALRCTCKALRDATNAWIHQLDIEVITRHGHEDWAWVESMEQIEEQLSRFPKAAVMHGLNLTCTLNEGIMPEIVSGLVMKAGQRLAGLRKLTVCDHMVGCATA